VVGVVQQRMTGPSCIGEASRNKNARVPWAQLTTKQDLFIDSEYLPEDVELTDPSKIHRDVTESIMQHWRDRQEDATEDVTFAFCGIEQKDPTGLVSIIGVPAVSRQPKSPAPANRKSKGKGKGKATPKGKGKGKGKGKQRQEAMNMQDDSDIEDDIAAKLKEFDTREGLDLDLDEEYEHLYTPVSFY
jgi:hypothetical protein